MAGTRDSLDIEVDDAELRRTLQSLIDRLGQPRDALLEVGEVLLASTRQRFRSGQQRAPDGTPWAPLSPLTLARKTNPNILTEHGYLADTLRYQLAADGQSVEVGTNRVYGAMHQFGGTKAQWPHLWGDIPARPFLGLADADRASVLEIFRDYLQRP